MATGTRAQILDTGRPLEGQADSVDQRQGNYPPERPLSVLGQIFERRNGSNMYESSELGSTIQSPDPNGEQRLGALSKNVRPLNIDTEKVTDHSNSLHLSRKSLSWDSFGIHQDMPLDQVFDQATDHNENITYDDVCRIRSLVFDIEGQLRGHGNLPTRALERYSNDIDQASREIEQILRHANDNDTVVSINQIVQSINTCTQIIKRSKRNSSKTSCSMTPATVINQSSRIRESTTSQPAPLPPMTTKEFEKILEQRLERYQVDAHTQIANCISSSENRIIENVLNTVSDEYNRIGVKCIESNTKIAKSISRLENCENTNMDKIAEHDLQLRTLSARLRLLANRFESFTEERRENSPPAERISQSDSLFTSRKSVQEEQTAKQSVTPKLHVPQPTGIHTNLHQSRQSLIHQPHLQQQQTGRQWQQAHTQLQPDSQNQNVEQQYPSQRFQSQPHLEPIQPSQYQHPYHQPQYQETEQQQQTYNRQQKQLNGQQEQQGASSQQREQQLFVSPQHQENKSHRKHNNIPQQTSVGKHISNAEYIRSPNRSEHSLSTTKESRVVKKIYEYGSELKQALSADPLTFDSCNTTMAAVTYDLPRIEELSKHLEKLEQTAMDCDIEENILDYLDETLRSSRLWKSKLDVKRRELHLHLSTERNLLKNVDLPKFTGSPYEQTIYSFLSTFFRFAGKSCSPLDQATLLYNSYLCESIKYEVESIQNNIDKMESYLLDQYGDLRDIAETRLRALSQIKHPTYNDASRIEYYKKVGQTLMQVESLGESQYVNSSEISAVIFSSGYVKQIISYMPDFVITKFSERLHNQTVNHGKPDGKREFNILKEIIEMSWKTIRMRSNIKTFREVQPAATSTTRNKSAHVTDFTDEQVDDHGETFNNASTASKLYFPCPIHKNSHELGECKYFFLGNNFSRKQLCVKNKMCWTCFKPKCFQAGLKDRTCISLSALPQGFTCKDCTGTNPFSVLTCANKNHQQSSLLDIEPILKSYFKILNPELLSASIVQSTNVIASCPTSDTYSSEVASALTTSVAVNTSSSRPKTGTRATDSSITPTFDTRKGKILSPSKVINEPTSDSVYIYQTIKVGGTTALVFYDTGASTNLVRGKFAEMNEFKVVDEENQRISGVANMGMWTGFGTYTAAIGPDRNGSYWQLTFQGISSITGEVPYYSWTDVNIESKELESLSGSEMLPPNIGGSPVDIIIGVKNPELVPVLEHVLPSGLGVYRCPFIDIHGSTLAYAGCHSVITAANQSCGHITINKTAVMLLKHETFEGFEISGEYNSLVTQPISVSLSSYQSSPYQTTALCGENLDYAKQFRSDHTKNIIVPSCSCSPYHKCFNTASFKAKVPLSQLKKLLEPDEPMVNFRCESCESCQRCKSSLVLRSSSIRERMETKIVEESVWLDYLGQRAVVKLPFTQDPQKFLSQYFKDGKSNFNQAVAVYKQQCRKKPEIKEMTVIAIKELIELGYIRRLKDAGSDLRKLVENAPIKHYHVWRPVFKDSLSTKTRVIVDPSSTMLNLCLAKANAGLNSMFSIMLRFRSSPEAWSGDIRKMYNQLKLDEQSVPYSLLLFSEDMDESKTPDEYYMESAWYGVISTGTQASVTLQRAGNDHSESHPHGAEALIRDVYVDDLNSGQQTRELCISQVQQVQEILSHIGMKCKYIAYSKSPPPSQASKDGESMSVLGMKWKPEADRISINLPEVNFMKKSRGIKPSNKMPVTNAEEVKKLCDSLQLMKRRDIVSKVGEFYDITGFCEPIKAFYKRAASRLNKLDWEDEIPDVERKFWSDIFQTWPELAKLSVPRSVVPSDAKLPHQIKIITCADSSDKCGGACLYLCFKMNSGSWSSQLLTAKSELLNMSVPRNELHSLLIAAELTYATIVSLNMEISEILLVTDSLVSLCWVMNEKSRNKIYVQNQITTIRRYMKWIQDKLGNKTSVLLAHISGVQNPADLLTKGSPTPESISESSTWMSGYPWMSLDTDEMPLTKFSDVSLDKSQINQYLEEVVHADPTSIPTAKEDKSSFYIYPDIDNSGNLHCILPPPLALINKSAVSVNTANLVPCKLLIDFIHIGWKKSMQILKKCCTYFAILQHRTHINTTNLSVKSSLVLKCKICILSFETCQQEKNPTCKFESEGKTEYLQCTLQVAQTGFGSTYEKDIFPDSSEVGTEIEKYNAIQAIKIDSDTQLDCVTPVIDTESVMYELNLEIVSSRIADSYVNRVSTQECLNHLTKKELQHYTMDNNVLFYNGRLSNEQRVGIHDLDMLELKFLDNTEISFHSPCVWPTSDIFYAFCMFSHHNLTIHGGVEATIVDISKRFYPINSRKIIASLISTCIKCKIVRKKTLDQAMKNHNSLRLSFAPGFSFIMIDLAQNFICKARHEGRQTVKIPALVVVCIITGATAVYSCEDWSTGSVILALTRHSDRYGVPHALYVDPGAQLKKLKDVSFNFTDMTTRLHRNKQWTIIVSVAKGHYMQGRVERKIETIRDLLSKLGKSNSVLSFLGWETLFCQISNHLNSIPICRSSGRSVFSPEFTVITANRLLLGHNNQRSLVGPLILDPSPSAMMKQIKEVQETFYRLLSKQVHLLIPKPKYHKDSLVHVGDVVLFFIDESSFNKKSQSWKYALVTKIEGTKLTLEYTNAPSDHKKYLQRNKREVVRIGRESELDFNSRHHKERVIPNI